MTTIGVISDTHGLLRPQALERLGSSDLIVHAGDIGTEAVLAGLAAIAPVRAIRGNVDRAGWAQRYPERDRFELHGWRIYVIHDRKQLDLDPVAEGLDLVISGHSHAPRCEQVDGVWYLNPGSAGPRRFKLPVAVAVVRLQGGRLDARIHPLEV